MTSDLVSIIHAAFAGLVALALVVAVGYLAATGSPIPGELSTAMGAAVGWLFGLGAGRRATSSHQ